MQFVLIYIYDFRLIIGMYYTRFINVLRGGGVEGGGGSTAFWYCVAYRCIAVHKHIFMRLIPMPAYETVFFFERIN